MIQLFKLHDHLYIRPHTKRVNTERLLTELENRGVRLVLNVALIDDPVLAAACRTVGMTYRHEPFNDSGAKLDRDRALTLAYEVAKSMVYGSVMIFCDSGWNRS